MPSRFEDRGVNRRRADISSHHCLARTTRRRGHRRRPDLADLVRTFIPDWPLRLLVPAALVFSVVNGAAEEAAYREVVFGALQTARIPARAALVLQAVAFAALHFRGGFPRGVVGLTFAYGLVLGEPCRRAVGLVVPFITHVLTDLVIVAIVLALVRA